MQVGSRLVDAVVLYNNGAFPAKVAIEFVGLTSMPMAQRISPPVSEYTACLTWPLSETSQK